MRELKRSCNTFLRMTSLLTCPLFLESKTIFWLMGIISELGMQSSLPLREFQPISLLSSLTMFADVPGMIIKKKNQLNTAHTFYATSFPMSTLSTYFRSPKLICYEL